jgi:transcriptional regulator with XRE-family HTH domain
MSNIKDRLNYLRVINKVTVKKITTYLDIKPQTYYSYECGKATPSVERLIKLSDFYSVSIDYLLGRSDSITYESKEHSKLALQLLESNISIDHIKLIYNVLLKLKS